MRLTRRAPANERVRMNMTPMYVQAVLLGCGRARVWMLSFGVAPRQEPRS
jgi:hypothetical protein